jgi:PAS domain S-box-containing protein
MVTEHQNLPSNMASIYEQAFENATHGLGVVRPDGSWIRVNRAFCRITGYAAQELMKLTIKAVTYPDDREKTQRLFDQLIGGEIDSYCVEKRCVRKDGKIIWVALNVKRAIATDGIPVAVGETLDITESKSTEESKQRIEALFRSIGENAGDLIMVVEFPSLVLEYASPTFLELLGLSPWKLMGRCSLELVLTEDHVLIKESLSEMIAGRTNGNLVNVRFLDAQGATRHVEAHGCAVRNGAGEIERVVVIGRIVDDRIAAQKQLEAREQQLQLLLDSTAEGIYGLDVEGNCTFCNRACTRMVGCKDPAEILGKKFHTLFHHTKKDGTPYPLEECPTFSSLGPATPTHVDNEIYWRADQSTFPVEYWSYPMWDRGKQVGSVVTFVDITPRKAAENELRSKTAFLEALTNTTLDGILVVDDRRNIIFQNQRFRQMMGIAENYNEETSDAELLDSIVAQTVNPNEIKKRVQFLNDHKEEVSRSEIELRAGVVLDSYSAPVIDKDGGHNGRMWIFRDITERRRNEDSIRKLSMAVEQSPVSVIITDLAGNITYVNGKFSETTGYSFEEVLGKTPRILKSGAASPQVYEHLWKTILKGGDWRGEFHNRKKNGDLHWESVAISPIKDKNGRPTHFLAVEEDITERKTMESQLSQAQKMEAIGQLAAGIAHEINTPIQFVGDNTRFVKESWNSLTPVISQLQSLMQSEAPAEAPQDVCTQLVTHLKEADWHYLQEEIPRALEQSLEGIARVARIVQAMKEFSHPDSDEKQLTDINKAILTTLTVARNEWKYVSEVETQLAADLEPVPCLVGVFNQVILNLLINAAHAIAGVVGDGSLGKGKITITTAQDREWTTISITDTGTGIAPEIRSKIYDPFFTTKAVGKGTGQGLSIAHNSIVKKHGGRLWFESEVGKGSTFHVQLPMTSKQSTK